MPNIVTLFEANDAVSRTAFNARLSEINEGAEAAIKDTVAKATLADADQLPLIDSEADNATKKIAWANIKAALGNVFAALIHTHPPTDLTGPVPADKGGTGQVTLAAARNAMGLGNTTGALPVANGGTGATSLGNITVGNSTKWNGYSIWKGTQAQYDAISSKSATTIYFIVG